MYHPAFRAFTKEWVDAAAFIGGETIFWDEPHLPLKKADGKAAVTVFDGADHFAVPSLTYPDGNTGIIHWLTDKADCIG